MRRPGDRIRVTWTTDLAIPHAIFVAAGEASRGGRSLILNAAEGTRHRKQFALSLLHVRGVRFVELTTYAPGRPVGRRLLVRVR